MGHRSISITSGGTGSIRLPTCSRWQILNGSPMSATITILETGGPTSGAVFSVTSGSSSQIMLPPNPSCYIRVAGVVGGVVWLLFLDDSESPPERI